MRVSEEPQKLLDMADELRTEVKKKYKKTVDREELVECGLKRTIQIGLDRDKKKRFEFVCLFVCVINFRRLAQ